MLCCIVLFFIENNGRSYQVCDPNVPAAPNRDGVRSQNDIGHASLGDDGDANNKFLTSLFIDKKLGIQFLKYVELLRSKVTYNTCGCNMAWCAGPKLMDGFRWRWRRTSASICCASTSVRYGSWCQPSSFCLY